MHFFFAVDFACIPELLTNTSKYLRLGSTRRNTDIHGGLQGPDSHGKGTTIFGCNGDTNNCMWWPWSGISYKAVQQPGAGSSNGWHLRSDEFGRKFRSGPSCFGRCYEYIDRQELELRNQQSTPSSWYVFLHDLNLFLQKFIVTHIQNTYVSLQEWQRAEPCRPLETMKAGLELSSC